MMIMSPEEALAVKLERLTAEHRDLDIAIEAMARDPMADQLALRRLKKRKLALKDEIARLEDRLTPDIIA
ncbi:YdcH family protein [Rhodovulum sp. DZ06]|uniref:YdcH family protein n=1 Tax=Rhodovulum sp. DZ06 TaxID=3425126 RepID=UPI003D32AEAE